MRIPIVLLLAATAGLAALTGAIAQDAPPADPPAKAEPPATGLSDLEDTVEGLQDDAPPAEPPAEAAPPPAPPAEAPPQPAPAPAPAPAAPSAPPPPLTRAQTAQLAEATQRGRLLFALARAGLLATQDMLSRVSDPAGAGIAGWIAEPEGNATTVTFYAEGESGAPPSAVYRVSILGGRVTSREVFLAGNRPPLGPHQARMAAARRTTDGLDHQACGDQPFNVLVVPPAAPAAPIDVYQMSPQTRRGQFPVGGHFKSTVAADGTVTASRGYTNACLDLAVPELPAGARPAPLAITHLLDPLPTEIHVFLALWTGRPLVVVADDPQRLFGVTGEGIGEIRP